ncbi:leucine-rich repeat and guanylate kinase domain-containing protein-like [Montipora foliosa]|uniref:leucine-rich repeat and guanylate kinase domain-containing protein-like n=1 Tax=Montipora foliosa TaxID=591990 RepID=UPI0035F1E61B
MTARSGRTSSDEKIEGILENVGIELTDPGQTEAVPDGTLNVVESQANGVINRLESDLSEMEEQQEVDEFEEMIADGLSQLGRSADGTLQVYLSLFLPGCELTEINCLQGYIHLQSLVLSHNFLTDLTPLGNMRYLLSLDVSHNQLETVLDFAPPLGLREVNLSHNKIEELPDLSAHQCLTSLTLDYNNISEIQGLSSCHRLSHLSLANNTITRIANLDKLPLKYLNLSQNNIKKIENLETVKYLEVIDLSGNSIRSMKGLQNHDLLQEIDLEENQIIDIAEVRYIRELNLLRNLNLLGNPIQGMPDYRLSLLFRIQCLTELDRSKVSVEEKVAAVNMFNPPPEVIAARDHMFHVTKSLLQPTRIHDSTLPSVDMPYPMLILCGPCGSGKRYLSRRLCQEFPDFFGFGVCHTTRAARKDEDNLEDYCFVSQEEFEQGVVMGKFLQTCQIAGNWYGVTREAVESVAREGLAAVFQMDLEGVLSFKNTYFEPRYVMVVPVSKKIHEARLRDRGDYTESQLLQALDRADVCIEHNSENPGFFDMAINSEDLTEAYKSLKRLIMGYLGMSPPSTVHSDLFSGSIMSVDSSQSEETLRQGDKSGTSQTTTVTVNQAARTWSRRSDTSTLPLKGVSLTQQKTEVEVLSLERRQTVAKAAVAGIHQISLEQFPRQTLSARFHPSSIHFSPDIKRSSSVPLNFNASLASIIANASSQTEARDVGLESNISESEEDQEDASSIMSSARAYSDNGVQSPGDSEEEEEGDSRDLLDFLPTEVLQSQENGSAPFSDVFGQVELANSI